MLFTRAYVCTFMFQTEASFGGLQATMALHMAFLFEVVALVTNSLCDDSIPVPDGQPYKRLIILRLAECIVWIALLCHVWLWWDTIPSGWFYHSEAVGVLERVL